MTWRTSALCRFLPDGWWDTDLTPDPEPLRVCLACPVVESCATEALKNGHGYRTDSAVWGATTVSQRHEIRSNRMTLERAWKLNRGRVERHDRDVSGWLDQMLVDRMLEVA